MKPDEWRRVYVTPTNGFSLFVEKAVRYFRHVTPVMAQHLGGRAKASLYTCAFIPDLNVAIDFSPHMFTRGNALASATLFLMRRSVL